jgi:hypothetical protein
MSIQYVHDPQGRRTAVIVPIEEWDALRVKNLEYAEDRLSPQESAEADVAWAAHLADPSGAQPVDEVMREMGLDPKG